MNATKQTLIAEIEKRVSDKILEQTNADLLIKLINNADSLDEAINIAALGTTYKRTGLHFDKRLEKMSDTIKYFKKNEKLSFHTDDSKPTHKLIIGDNYEALQNLLIQYRGKIDVIYIDPPYGKDSMGEFAKTNYQNAITRDNLLSMLYPRLVLAKQLLSDEGVIFCSIDDKNQAYVKCLMDEVMGEENFIADVIWHSKYTTSNDSNDISRQHEHVLVYARKFSNLKMGLLERTEEMDAAYKNPDNDPKGKWKATPLHAKSGSESNSYEITFPNGRTWKAPLGRFPRYSKERLMEIYNEGGLSFNKSGGIDKKTYLSEVKQGKTPGSVWRFDEVGSSHQANEQLAEVLGKGVFDNPKPIGLIQRSIKISDIHKSESAIILDFFAGSGTTGHAVLDLNKDGGNRTFILCQLNEKTDTTPNGIAYDVTSKRLKRIMTGECYDGTKDFEWIKKNKPYGGNLDVYEIESVSNFEWTEGKTPFDVIDETLYGKEKFANIKEKIEWVCGNFDKTQKYLEQQKTEE